MDLTENTKQCFNFLKKWEAKNNMFNLSAIFSIELIPEISKSDFFKHPGLGVDVSPLIKNYFYYFAVDGAGGEYALWDNGNVKNEHAVVYLNSEGQHKMLAPSLYYFILKIPKRKEVKKVKKYGLLEDLVDTYENNNDSCISLKKAKKLMLKDMESYTELLVDLPTSLKSNVSKKDFLNMLEITEKESQRLLLILTKMRNNKVKVDDFIEKTIVDSVVYQTENEYKRVIQNGTKWTDNYVLGFVDKIEILYELSLNGYNKYLPKKNIFIKWLEEINSHIPNLMKNEKKKTKKHSLKILPNTLFYY